MLPSSLFTFLHRLLSLLPILSPSLPAFLSCLQIRSSMAELRSHGGDRKLETTVKGGNVSRENNNQLHTRPSCPHRPSVHPPPRSSSNKPHKTSSSSSCSSFMSSWSFNDSEMKRRKRVAKYKAYGVEGRVKASFRKGIRWIKNRCSEILHGY